MSDRHIDFDPEEQEFLRAFGTSPQDLRSGERNCPPPDRVLAAHSGNLTDEHRAEILAHQVSCGSCSALLSDLTNPELADPQPEEAARIRSRVFDSMGAGKKRTWRPLHPP